MSNVGVQWSGWGKWLAFALAAVLMLLSIPLILHSETGAAAGWNLFLGLLIFGSVVSHNKGAASLVAFVAALMIVRLILTAASERSIPDIILAAILVLLALGAALHLRRQIRMPMERP